MSADFIRLAELDEKPEPVKIEELSPTMAKKVQECVAFINSKPLAVAYKEARKAFEPEVFQIACNQIRTQSQIAHTLPLENNEDTPKEGDPVNDMILL